MEWEFCFEKEIKFGSQQRRNNIKKLERFVSGKMIFVRVNLTFVLFSIGFVSIVNNGLLYWNFIICSYAVNEFRNCMIITRNGKHPQKHSDRSHEWVRRFSNKSRIFFWFSSVSSNNNRENLDNSYIKLTIQRLWTFHITFRIYKLSSYLHIAVNQNNFTIRFAAYTRTRC